MMMALFPGSSSFRAIIQRMTFDPPERKVATIVMCGVIAAEGGRVKVTGHGLHGSHPGGSAYENH